MNLQVRQLRKVNSDLAGLLDEWATSLFRELDYQREARNGARFRELYGDMPVPPFLSLQSGIWAALLGSQQDGIC